MFLVLVYLLIVTSRALERSRVYYPNTILIKQAQPMAATSFGRPWLSEDWQWQGRSISYSEVANDFGHSRALGSVFLAEAFGAERATHSMSARGYTLVSD